MSRFARTSFAVLLLCALLDPGTLAKASGLADPKSGSIVSPLVFFEGIKTHASDPDWGDHYGFSSAISGDTAVVGTPFNEGAASNSGCAYVLQRNHGGADLWGEVAILRPSDPENGDYFGEDVGISGDTVVVGARGNGDSGAAYVFERNHGGADNWGEVAKLTYSLATNSQLGDSVSISGDLVVAGAPYDSHAGSSSGSAVIFGRNWGGTDNWGAVVRLTMPGAEAGDFFGEDLAISGGTAVIGARNDDNPGLGGSGSVFVFSRNQGGADNWGFVKKVKASDAAEGDLFGMSVAIDGNTIVAGANKNSDAGLASGAAYVFERNHGGAENWGEVKKLTASDAAAVDEFGRLLSVSDNTVLISSYRDDDNGSESGSVYVFQRNFGGPDNWGEFQKLTASDGAADDYFGASVGVSGENLIVCASKTDEVDENTGSAYLFSTTNETTTRWYEVDTIVHSTLAGWEYYGGAAAATVDRLVIGATGAGPAGTAFMFERNQGGVDNWGETRSLISSDAVSADFFGCSISMTGDTVAIGAYGAGGTDRVGHAYIFERNHGGVDNWGEVKIIEAATPDVNDFFAWTVSLSGDFLVVGSQNDDDLGSDAGAAYIFERNQGGADNWGQIAKLTASDGAAEDYFGLGVSISGDTAVVGAPGDDDSGSSSGSIYVFYRNTGGADNWGQAVKLTATDGASNDNFGLTVLIKGDTIFAAAPDEGGTGSVYVMGRNQGGADNWGEETKITPSSSSPSMWFGRYIAASDSTLVIPAPNDDAIGTDSGSTYIYSRNYGGLNAWGEDTKLTASITDDQDKFGSAVGIAGEFLVIGASWSDLGGTRSGAASLFRHGPIVYDFGDALDPTYPTVLASNGARHALGGALFMGSSVDVDADGQPTSDASGDDTDAEGDDEDGVVFNSLLIPGMATEAEIEVSAPGFLNAWIDFNNDGDWADPDEQIFTDEPVVTGLNPESFAVPSNASSSTTTFARFRVDSTGGLSFDGEAPDGEVEDEMVIIEGFDYGDAPDPAYPTLVASDGARHVDGVGLFLGLSVDHEPDGQPTALADGDDTNGADDEDGIVFTTGLGAGLTASVDVTASGAGLLSAWIDFNADGDWADVGEQIFTDESLASGVNPLIFSIPLDATLGTTFARFRFDSVGGLSFTGIATDGEVEDYLVEIVQGPDLGIDMIASAEPAPSGRPFTYTITVTNNGPIDATAVAVTDTLPGELIFVSSTPGAPDCTFASDTLTCDLGTMAPTDTAQITIETVLDHPVWGAFNNTSSVTANETDPITANNTATVDTNIALFVDDFESGDLSAWD